jgi:hypothetical protein
VSKRVKSFERPIAASLPCVSAALLLLSALSFIKAGRDWRTRLAEAEAGEGTAA